MIHRFAVEIGGRTFEIETGRVAKQASGSVWIRYGDTVVLSTVVGAKEAAAVRDFLAIDV